MRSVLVLSKYCLFLSFALAVVVSILPAYAATNTLTPEERLVELLKIRSEAVAFRKRPPSSGYGTISGYTMGGGTGFVSLSVSSVSKATENIDASSTVGFGFGDPYNNIGLDFYLGIISLNPETERGSFSGIGEDGAVSFKIGKIFNASNNSRKSFAFALGVNHAGAWGDATESNRNIYGVGSFRSDICINGFVCRPYSLSLGVGSHQVNNETDGGFVGLGLGLTSNSSFGLSYSGDQWLAGFNIVHRSNFDKLLSGDVNISVGIQDLLDNQSSQRIAVTVSYAFKQKFFR